MNNWVYEYGAKDGQINKYNDWPYHPSLMLVESLRLKSVGNLSRINEGEILLQDCPYIVPLVPFLRFNDLNINEDNCLTWSKRMEAAVSKKAKKFANDLIIGSAKACVFAHAYDKGWKGVYNFTVQNDYLITLKCINEILKYNGIAPLKKLDQVYDVKDPQWHGIHRFGFEFDKGFTKFNFVTSWLENNTYDLKKLLIGLNVYVVCYKTFTNPKEMGVTAEWLKKYKGFYEMADRVEELMEYFIDDKVNS